MVPATHSSANPAFSIIVTNWQGEEWIVRTLSSLQLSARAAKLPFELIMVDDASADKSVALARRHFPQVRILVNRRNMGFGAATMRGVRAARAPVIILCNNDLAAQEPFIPNLVRWFRADAVSIPGTRQQIPAGKLFAVGARTLSWYDGQPNQLCMNARFLGGRITPAWSDPATAEPCLFVQAGAAAYSRRHFLALGGFLTVYAPGYWEDYDISYAAARSGLVSLYDPEAVALHHGGGSMTKRFGQQKVARMKARNHLLFEWANLSSPALLAQHAAWLGLSLMREWLGSQGELPLTHALREALPLCPKILGARLRRSRNTRSSDPILLRRFSKGTPSFH